MNDSLIQELTQVAQRWQNRQYPLRLDAFKAAHEFRLSAASFHLALDWIFSQWTEDRIAKIITENPFKQPRYAAQILAGNTPAIIAQGFLQGAILNVPQCIKIPQEQTVFARLLHESFAECAKDTARLFEVDTWQNNRPEFYAKLAHADVVLAYGSDETMVTLKQHLKPEAIYCAHGHAESAAVIFKEALDTGTLVDLAYDFLSYDQRGCLSPRIVYIEQGGAVTPEQCAQRFAQDILPRIAQELPRGGLFAGEAAAILHQRNLCAFRGPLYCGDDWTVSYAEHQPWPEVILPRFMLFAPFTTADELATTLLPQQKSLILMGLAGAQEKMTFLSQTLKAPSCPIGQMQKRLLVW